MFEKNVGQADRIARAVAGVLALAAFFMGLVAAPWSYLLLLVAIIMLATAALGTCGLYSLLGINTAKK